MKVTPLKIPDVKLIEPDVFEDERGFFYESFNQQKFNEAIGENITFVQDNHSRSSKGVLRGLHYQEEPFAQGKLVRVVVGEVFDVAVDIRKDSSTHGQWVSEILSAENKKQLWIPGGFAHGFLTLSNEAEFLYKTTDFYNKKVEKVIHYLKNSYNIDWPISHSKIVLSNKDEIIENSYVNKRM
ncbi:dTDP-4-dehydrorhamnose 3,5-epimerase [Methylophilaceae bacterium]|nr:dTDP-4-dehydrorhamnose 3,5-epimerase [Methylophilaceae bacterium]